MRLSLLAIARWILLIWGGVSLIGVIAITGLVAFSFGPGNRDKDESASSADVRFVLNWCELGDKRIEKVVHSRVSARSFTGDHLDAYAIKISHVDLAELTANTDDSHSRWYRGDQLPKMIDDAVAFVSACHGEIPWFPTEAELRGADYYVYPGSIHFYGVRPNAAELIFIRPADKMVFYFSLKT